MWYNTECESMRRSYFKTKHQLHNTIPVSKAADIQLNDV